MKTRITYSRLFEKQIEKMPLHIKKRIRGWIFAVSEEGINKAIKLRTYRDEALKGKRKGQRSIRLNRAYRLIYEIIDQSVHIHICEVNKHEGAVKANKLPVGVNPTRAKLASGTELNSALSEVTILMKPEEWMYQAATKVNAYSPVITIAVEADVVHVYGRRNSSNRYWQDSSYSTGVIAAA